MDYNKLEEFLMEMKSPQKSLMAVPRYKKHNPSLGQGDRDEEAGGPHEKVFICLVWGGTSINCVCLFVVCFQKPLIHRDCWCKSITPVLNQEDPKF